MAGNDEKKHFKIQWWWNSDEEDKIKKDPEYAKKIQIEKTNNEELARKVDESAKKDPKIAESLERAKEELKNEEKGPKNEEDNSFFPWGSGSNKNNAEKVDKSTDPDASSSKKEIDGATNKSQEGTKNTNPAGKNDNKDTNSVSDKNADKNSNTDSKNVNGNGIDKKTADINDKDPENNSGKGSYNNNDKNDLGKDSKTENEEKGGWFNWGSKKSQQGAENDVNQDSKSKNENKNDAESKNEDEGTSGLGVNKNTEGNDGRDQNKESDNSKDNQADKGGGWFNWGSKKENISDSNGVNQGDSKDGQKNSESQLEKDNQEETLSNKNNGSSGIDNDTNDNKTSTENSNRNTNNSDNSYGSDDNGDKSKSRNLNLVLGCLNLFMIFSLLLYTQVLADCSVAYQWFLLCCLAVGLLPFVLLANKNNPNTLMSILSTVLTIIILTSLFMNRVRVYFYRVSLVNESLSELVRIKNLSSVDRFNAIVKLESIRKTKLKDHLEHSNKLGIKVLLLEYPLAKEIGKEKYDPDRAKDFFKNELKAHKDERNPIIRPFYSLDWGKIDARNALASLGKTRFSSFSNEFVAIIGMFELDKEGLKSLNREIEDITLTEI